MSYGEIILWCVKLIFGGVAAFLAILLWSKTRRADWMCLSSSVLIFYVGILYEMLSALGVVPEGTFVVYGIPVLTLFFSVVPALLLIVSLILIVKELS